jgi:hypothetical protein
MPFLTFIFYLFLLKFPWDLNLCYYLNIVLLVSKKIRKRVCKKDSKTPQRDTEYTTSLFGEKKKTQR